MNDGSNRVKQRVGAAIFRFARVKRLHIIGCARSGTTFLQYCMLAYKNTHVENAETSAHYPDLLGKIALARRSRAEGSMNYITKRTYGWFQDTQIEELLDAVQLYQMGLILVLRDPRSVLVSRHRRAPDSAAPYVDEERWYRSILAGEKVWAALSDHPCKCVVGYDDLIDRPSVVDERIRDTFGLSVREGVTAINEAKTNADRIGYCVSPEQRAAMHGLKDADPARLERNPQECEIASDEVRRKYLEYVARFEAGDDFSELL